MSTRFFRGGVLSIFCFFAVLTVRVYCQDPFEPDTVRFGEWTVDLTGPEPYQGTAMVPLVIFNDEPLGRVDIPLTWTGSILCDSGRFVGERAQHLMTSGVPFNNEEKWLSVFAVGGHPLDPPYIPSGEGDFVNLYFSVLDTGIVTIDSSFLPWQEFVFLTYEGMIFCPRFLSTEFHIQPPPPQPGDINGDGIVNVGDVVALVGYLYRGHLPPDSLNQADVNGDCEVNVGDVIYLVNYLYRNGPEPQEGCAF